VKRVAIALLLLVAACSSGGDEPKAPTPSTTAPAPSSAFGGIRLTRYATVEQPTAMSWCPDGTAYVAERTGRVKRLPERDTVIDVSNNLSTLGEQGLLGIACSPDGGTMVVSFTNRAGDTRVLAYSMPDPSVRAPRTLLAVDQLGINHNGGNVAFGPDGKLWFGLGDGGGGSGERFTTSQDPDTYLGKIVRMDLDGGRLEIMVSGLRNPWRWSFDRETGDLWIADVGEGSIEEIDKLHAERIKGANLGWPALEGSKRARSNVAVPDDVVAPVYEYGRDQGSAVVGGYVYRGEEIPGLQGDYLFVDAYRPRIHALDEQNGAWQSRRDIDVPVPGGLVSSFAEDPSGELFVLSLEGAIYRIDPVEPASNARIDLTARPETPATAHGAASMLADAEASIHDPERAADESDRLAHAAHVEQVAVRAIAEHPDWDREVLDSLPDEWDQAMRDNVTASRELRALVGRPHADLPAWHIVEPAPADELRRYYEEGERAHGVPWEYLAAVHLVETKMGRIRGASTAGALGPMQFLPATWARYGQGDIESNHDSILTAARYLAANGAPRDMHAALFRYNHSERYVRAVTLYAERMRADPLAYRAYHGWQVYYWSTLGDVWLRTGWSLDAPRPVQPSDL
jgi:glucose/arabinose dehydrogenase